MLSKEQVQHIATLARIGLAEEEIEKFQKDLSGVLDYFERLEGVDVTHVEPMTHTVELKNVSRNDIVARPDEETLSNIRDAVPETHEYFVKVQSILRHE